MSKYTTGEIAKHCGVSVRTVQYYDSRGILTPSELSEGGRRLYSDDDLKKLKIICFLREIGLSINSIGQLFNEENSNNVISVLLEQHKQLLEEELKERQSKLRTLEYLEKTLKSYEHFSVDSIGDIAHLMENKKKLFNVRRNMIVVGVIMDIIEIVTLVLWIVKGVWLPFVIGMLIVLGMGIWVSVFYFRSVSYICPQCHKVFKPTFRQTFFAKHTPRTRKLTCPSCGYKGFCIETYDDGSGEL